jgi:hypothetical protein
MFSIRSIAVRIGLVGGVVFFLNALIPNSQSYPFIWPLLTGAVAFWVTTSDAAAHPIRRGMSATLISGIIVGLVGFVGATFTVLALSRPVFSPLTPALGAVGAMLATLAGELGVAVVAILAAAVTLVGGAAMIPVRLARRPHPKAPAL